MRRWAWRIIAVVLVVLSAGLTSRFLLQAATSSPEQPAVATIKVELGDVADTIAAAGTLEPRTYVDVGVQVSGQLRRLHVGYGDRVVEGQLIAELDPTIFQSRVAADRAQLQSLRAQIREKQAQATLAQLQAARRQRLAAQKATSEEALENALAARTIVLAQIDGLAAQVQATESSLQANLANLAYTRISAPMAGVVVDLLARQGQTLNANQQAPLILRIADLDVMSVRSQVSEADVPRLRLGMSAYFTTLGDPQRQWSGRLRQIVPTPQIINNVVLFNAMFEVENPSHHLLPQMSAQVFFITAEAKQSPVIPVSAMRPLPGQGDRYAVRLQRGDKIIDQEIEITARNRVSAAVASGLSVGDQILPDPVAPMKRTPSPWMRTPRI